MKRFLLLGAIVALLGGGIFAYVRFGGSPEVKRERSLKAARAYLEQSKVKEAIVEFRNALKADPASAEAHYEFGMALIRQGDLRSAYREMVRATDISSRFSIY
jgi:Tfp pilus assembly protein PilF